MNLRTILVAVAVTIAVAPTNVSAQTTPASMTTVPKATTVAITPAPTPAPKATPAPTTLAPTVVVTPVPSCRSVSVEGDASYCIQGPICSGRGDKPAGSNCPKIGDVAVADCLKYIKSYTNTGKCVAPVNAVCKVIKTGAWGCVWVPATTNPTTTTSAPTTTKPTTTTSAPTAKPTAAPVAQTTKPPAPPTTVMATLKATPAPTVAKANSIASTNSTNSSTDTVVAPKTTTPVSSKVATLLSVESDTGSTSGHSGTYAVGAGAVGAAAVVAAAVVYNRNQRSRKTIEDTHVAVVTP